MLITKPESSARALPWLALAVSLLVSLGVWNWAENILVPADTVGAVSKGVPIGNNSDLYPRWLGAPRHCSITGILTAQQ